MTSKNKPPKPTSANRAKPIAWPATPISFDASAIQNAYTAVRPILAKDPLFTKDGEEFGVSLAELDTRMAKPPKQATKSDDLYLWLDGADQYRYAGLHVLLLALGGGKPLALAGNVLVPDNATRITRGDVTIDGNLELGVQAMVIVLGKLTIKGVIIAGDFDYSMIGAREIVCRGGLTGGELIATERIVATGPLYLSGNDYSCRAPLFEGDLLVDFERGNAFTKVKVKKRLTDWDFEKAAKALGVSGDRSLGEAFRDKLTAT